MDVINQISLGLNSLLRAHRFIAKEKLWMYVLLPGIINILIFIGIILFAWQFSDYSIAYLSEKMIGTGELSTGMKMISYFIQFLIRILLLLFYLLIYKQVVLLIMSPIMAFLAELVAEKLGYKVPKFNMFSFISNVWRGIKITSINLFKELLVLLLLGFVSIIPLLNFSVPVIGFMVSSYYYGFSIMDYTNEVRGRNTRESGRFVWQAKGIAVSLGASFYVLLIIPLVGLLIAPTYCVVASVLAIDDYDKQLAQGN